MPFLKPGLKNAEALKRCLLTLTVLLCLKPSRRNLSKFTSMSTKLPPIFQLLQTDPTFYFNGSCYISIIHFQNQSRKQNKTGRNDTAENNHVYSVLATPLPPMSHDIVQLCPPWQPNRKTPISMQQPQEYHDDITESKPNPLYVI